MENPVFKLEKVLRPKEEEMQDFVSLLERVKANIIKMDQETNGKDDVN